MRDLDHKEAWAQKNSCFWIVVLEKTLESPLDCKEIKPVKGNRSWIFIQRTDDEVPTLWWCEELTLLEKTLMLGKIEGRRRRRWQRMRWVGWHHRLNRHEFEQTPGDSEGQGRLACYSPWGHRESDITERQPVPHA